MEEDCDEGEGEDVKGQYGDWLRASPIRHLKNHHHKVATKAGNMAKEGEGKGLMLEGQIDVGKMTQKSNARKSLKDILEAANSGSKEGSVESGTYTKHKRQEVNLSNITSGGLEGGNTRKGVVIENEGKEEGAGEKGERSTESRVKENQNGVERSSTYMTSIPTHATKEKARTWKRLKGEGPRKKSSEGKSGGVAGKWKEIEGADFLGELHLMEVEVKETKGRTEDVVMEDTMRLAGAVENLPRREQ